MRPLAWSQRADGRAWASTALAAHEAAWASKATATNGAAPYYGTGDDFTARNLSRAS